VYKQEIFSAKALFLGKEGKEVYLYILAISVLFINFVGNAKIPKFWNLPKCVYFWPQIVLIQIRRKLKFLKNEIFFRFS